MMLIRASQHHHFMSNFAKKFGNAAIFGAGASMGSEIIRGIF